MALQLTGAGARYRVFLDRTPANTQRKPWPVATPLRRAFILLELGREAAQAGWQATARRRRLDKSSSGPALLLADLRRAC